MRSAPELVCCSAAGRFAVVISLSHVLGDGFTYYRIYGALDQREKEIGQAPHAPMIFQCWNVIISTSGKGHAQSCSPFAASIEPPT